MAKFSLINIQTEKDGKISGYWIQGHIGTLVSAKQVASRTEKANSNKIAVGIVEAVSTTTPALHYFRDLKRLDR